VKLLREESSLSRQQLAGLSDLREVDVTPIENGAKPILLEEILCLARSLGVTPAELFETWWRGKTIS